LAAIGLWASGASAGVAERAGIVTARSGPATLERPGSNPAPLAHREQLGAGDVVRTGDSGTMRALLGGKALLTLGEGSTVAIGEQGVALTSGRATLGVARQLVRPGEFLEAHTPEATARVRGGLLLMERLPGGPVKSRFTVLEGSVDLMVPLRGTLRLAERERVEVGAAGATAIERVPEDLIAELRHGLQVRRSHEEPASELTKQIAASEMTRAEALARALVQVKADGQHAQGTWTLDSPNGTPSSPGSSASAGQADGRADPGGLPPAGGGSGLGGGVDAITKGTARDGQFTDYLALGSGGGLNQTDPGLTAMSPAADLSTPLTTLSQNPQSRQGVATGTQLLGGGGLPSGSIYQVAPGAGISPGSALGGRAATFAIPKVGPSATFTKSSGFKAAF
jgi:hypothetical protein